MKRGACAVLLLLAACGALPFPPVVAVTDQPAPALLLPVVARAELRAVCRQPGFVAAFSLVAASRGGDELRVAALDELGGTLFTAVHASGRVAVLRCSARVPASLAVALAAGLAAVLRPAAPLIAVRTADGNLAGLARRGEAELLYSPGLDGGFRVQCGAGGLFLTTVDVESVVGGADGCPLRCRIKDMASGFEVVAESVVVRLDGR